MKKIIAIMLCMLMMIGCAAAETEDKTNIGSVDMNGVFSLQCVMPDGYRIENVEQDGDGSRIYVISSEEAGKPLLMMSIAFNELLADVERMNDLPEDALTEIENSFREEDQVEISYTETAFGTKLMVIKEAFEDVDFVDFYTVYKGYEIEFVLVKGISAETLEGLTAAEIQAAVDFLSNMDFVPAE